MRIKWNMNWILSGICSLGLVACSHGCEKKQAVKEKGGAAEKALVVTEPVTFPVAIKRILKQSKWSSHSKFSKKAIPSGTANYHEYVELKGDRETYLKVFDLGTKFLLKYQLKEGNFKYQYDWMAKTWAEGDSQVRQAGSLWGISLCHQFRPTEETKAAIKKGLEFWFNNSAPGPNGSLVLKYKDEKGIDTGSVALVALAIVEYLRTEKELAPEENERLNKHLDGLLKFLTYLQLPSGHFAINFNLATKERTQKSSPYFDGEALLALTKAARYLDHKELIPVIEKSARATAEFYTVEAWKKDKDSPETKGFYQWSSMAFTEYYFAKWKDYEIYGDVVLVLAYWMIHVHRIKKRNLNTSYALEGLTSAYQIAQDRKMKRAAIDLLYIIDRVLYKLSTWQVGGPLSSQCSFLAKNPTDDEWAIGGMMNSRKRAKKPKSNTTYHELRLDVTQHHMHAVIKALNLIYVAPKEKQSP